MKNEGTLPVFENSLHEGSLIIRKRVTTSGPDYDPDTEFRSKVRLIGPTVEDKTVIYDVSTIEDSQSGGEPGETPSTPGEESGERKSCNIKAVLIYCKNIEAEGCALCTLQPLIILPALQLNLILPAGTQGCFPPRELH